MRYREAKKLHNEDEFFSKEDKLYYKVISVAVYEKKVIVSGVVKNGATYKKFHHADIS